MAPQVHRVKPFEDIRDDLYVVAQTLSCPHCMRGGQLQLVRFDRVNAVWRCRFCQHKWNTEIP
jgi:ribosomal protein L37AE/L43A